MQVKYIGQSDRRELSSADFEQTNEGEGWVIVWTPDQVHEIGDELGHMLVKGMKNEFRDVTEYETEEDRQAVYAVQEDRPQVNDEAPEDGYWAIHKDEPAEEVEDVETEEDAEAEEPELITDGHELSGLGTEELEGQMKLRELDPEGLTRRKMLNAIRSHDESSDASDEAPEDA